MDPGILLAVTSLDYSMGCVPVAVGVMPQAHQRATDVVGHRFVVEAGAEGFEGALGHVRVKCLPMDCDFSTVVYGRQSLTWRSEPSRKPPAAYRGIVLQ